jgi:hypothetical protein
LKADGYATIKGKVTYAGTPPSRAKILVPPDKQDVKDYCEKGDMLDPSLIVAPDGAVANVVIWIRPPQGKYFEIPADQQKAARPLVKLDQPFCAFEPHVEVLYADYYDEKAKEQKPTGQEFEVANSATISHNTNWSAEDPRKNQGDNRMLPSKVSPMKIPFKPYRSKSDAGQEDLITFKCDIHKWMNAYVWVFDHPYAAVTKPDGTYEIKNVPAGSKLNLVAWQEKMLFLSPSGKGVKAGQEIDALKSGETKTIDFKVGGQ